MKKRFITLLLALYLCAAILPVSASASDSAIPKDSPEYDALEAFLYSYVWWGADYDASKPVNSTQWQRNLLQAMLSEDYCYSDTSYPGPNREVFWNYDGKTPDPLNRFDSHTKISVSKTDWILENIFNCTAADITAMKATLDKEIIYTYDGYYYLRTGGIGGGYDVEILDIILSGQRYYVTYRAMSMYDEDWSKYHAVFELKNIDGKNYWSLYSNKKLADGEIPDIPASASPSSPSQPAANGFSDVAQTAYYSKAVRWGVEQGIVSGTGANTFSPNRTCTKAEIITFLWRANGSPAPTKTNPFSDITESRYYYQAAVWAYENGLTSGKKFSADEPCTRASVVTYLWELAGKPVVRGNPFADVSFDKDYARAVVWAVSKGITGGTSDTAFSPDAVCTRAQIVTFLYRNAGHDTLTPPSLMTAGISNTYASWRGAYRDFVYGENFLTVDFPYRYVLEEDFEWIHMPPWGRNYARNISLRDLDSDGTPELIISNGHGAALDRGSYVYTFLNSKIEYIGNSMLEISYIPDSQYNGIFAEFYAGSGEGSTSYYWKEGSSIQRELVYTYSRNFDGENEERVTENDALYYSERNDAVPLYSATAEEIEQMGWDTFVSRALA